MWRLWHFLFGWDYLRLTFKGKKTIVRCDSKSGRLIMICHRIMPLEGSKVEIIAGSPEKYLGVKDDTV